MLLVYLENMNKRLIIIFMHALLEINLVIFHLHSLSFNPIGSGVKALSEGIRNCKELKTLT